MVGWEGIAEGSSLGEHNFRVSKHFMPEEAVISAADFVSFVQCPFAFYPVQEITHDRSMTLPTFWSGLDLSVPVKVSGPAAVGRVSRDAHQLCSKVINLNPITTFTIGYLVQSMAVLLKDAVFETHILTSGTNAPRDQAEEAYQECRSQASRQRRRTNRIIGSQLRAHVVNNLQTTPLIRRRTTADS